MQFDTTIKDIFRMRPRVLMQMVAGSPIKEFLPTDFRSTRWREPDLLIRLENGCLAQLELQTGGRRLEQRMLSYRAEIREVYQEPVLQIVLYLGEQGGGICAIDEPDLSFRYHAVRMRDLDAEPLLRDGNLADKILALLCKVHDPQPVARVVAQAIRETAAPQDLREKLLVVSSLRRLEALIREELDMPITLDEIPILRDAYEKGQQEGRQEGATEQARATFSRLLARKFGVQSSDFRERIASASLSDLCAWTDRVVTSSTIDDVFDARD
jgi:predicted transposase YdaD